MSTLPVARRSQWPVWLCWLAMVLDGFDLVVLGTVIPTLIKTQDLGFDAIGATYAATISLVGVGIGALFIAPLSDRFGRRRLLVACVAWFSLFTIAVVFAPNVAMFGIFRLLAGVGLGACLPAALAYMNDYAPAGTAGKSTTRTMTGYHVGAVATAFLAILVVPDWRIMFVVGGLAGFVLVPFLWFRLPETLPPVHAEPAAINDAEANRAESPAPEARRAGPARTHRPIAVPAAEPEAAPASLLADQAGERASFRDLTRKPYPLVALGIAVASFMGLLLVYGLNTWLPQLMSSAGYTVSTGLVLLLVLNVGAVVGLIVAGILADKHGTKKIVLLWFGLSALFLAALSIKVQSELLLNAAVFVTGVFVFSSQVLVYAWVSQLFPARLRGTALGFAAGVGRLGAIMGPAVTGTLVAAGIAYPWGFYVFAGAAVLGLLALVTVPHAIAPAPGQPSDVGRS
ncbi:putative 4-hydroxybenzoate/protocatechuate transporter [Arthrobacter globiformis NBRC 12137]|uniref:Putative 4-hydroxybenzoate/protocatechuate transporter n=1 Tax=Arthrobacter globiformis (strain ATCC 8010 / DSM 20124 / JCM 1332 / NBRC 12137 / NCIMB 8907 / NRRL B-2979 / 168) TaxID=1077972 RepID=H0QSI3_ARTG1|nr:aromatic acid/H+ symport family MFS transporter [Arthrobacter globiformis]GAB15784.1 putative 4-hydroxybenzoate/protocatechuate transporter [Arthrobacter globiformis NBRC 12137]